MSENSWEEGPGNRLFLYSVILLAIGMVLIIIVAILGMAQLAHGNNVNPLCYTDARYTDAGTVVCPLSFYN